MAFIRDRREERTGFQCSAPCGAEYDVQCDFVMVYGMNDTTAQRIKMFREKGYVIHLMVGIAWGAYTDYLYGEYDGTDHWDEAQTDRYGNRILHGTDMPYMVPTVSFADYITEKLKKAVDLGVEAIHVEEPEFWDRGGYSEAFRREYKIYYKEDWVPPHESVDARFKCSKLKQYLYTRTIDRVSTALKEYSLRKYGRPLRFYVPTHSILNYTQWKIVSPEGKLADLPCVDGCIAQVWTGTSREENWYEGVYKERTFETAYLEYGVMQELVKNTGRRMWFLHDPIEDNPLFDWNDYEKNYFCTVVASLLHPKINTFEICPWPNRVFLEKYPRGSENAVTIPERYKTLLNNTFQTLGAMESADEPGLKVGILMADAQLYQRDYPDSEFSVPAKEEVGTVLVESEDFIAQVKRDVICAETPDRELLLKHMASSTFPMFYGLALPLLKYGIGVRPVLLDNVRRYAGYLDDYDVLLASYEFLKPDSPDMNASIAEWVKRGSTLIYFGDGADPYHKIRSWWTDKYDNPAQHLFEMLGVSPSADKGIYRCGKGKAAIWNINPCFFTFSKKYTDQLRAFFCESVPDVKFKNHLLLRRNEFVIAAVMDESLSETPLTLHGLFADMMTPDFSITTCKSVYPGEKCILCDLNKLLDEPCVIGTSVRVLSLEDAKDACLLRIAGAGDFTANIRLRISEKIKGAAFENGDVCCCKYDDESRTVLLTFSSVPGVRNLRLFKEISGC